MTPKLFALCISRRQGNAIVSHAGYAIAVSEEEAIGKGIKLTRERFPNGQDYQCNVIEIPLDTLRDVINGARHLKSVP